MAVAGSRLVLNVFREFSVKSFFKNLPSIGVSLLINLTILAALYSHSPFAASLRE